MINIVLVCALGISSGVLARSIRHAAAARDQEVRVRAWTSEDIADIPDDTSVVLVGPHMDSVLGAVSRRSQALGIPFGLLDPDVYTRMDGAAALDTTWELLRATVQPPVPTIDSPRHTSPPVIETRTMDTETATVHLIAHAGDARSQAMTAIAKARSGDISAARQLLATANKALQVAHTAQTQLIQQEAAGELTQVSLLLVHAQDHLMNAMTVRDLAAEFVDLYERTNSPIEGGTTS